MKLRSLTRSEAIALVDELRSMAECAPGESPATLRRAKAIRFQLIGQPGTAPTAAEKADETYRDLEILLHAHHWRKETSVDHLRTRIKSSCERLRSHLGLA